MTNAEIIRDKVRFHIRDIKFTEYEVDDIVLQVITDIANETGLFKKINGFTIHEDKYLYDFRDITRMNEQTEVELSAVTIGAVPQQDIIEWMQNPTYFPDPSIKKTQYVESDAESMLVNVLDIFDYLGRTVTKKFKYHGTSTYYVENETWLKENDKRTFAVTCSVIPHIDELLPEDLQTIMSTIIEGCKYYFNDTLQGQSDAQVANLFYQRYWQKKQALVNQFPTQIISVASNRSWV